MDTVPRETRSRTMRAVHSQDTRLELAFRQALTARGLRGYRVSPRHILGRPDVAYPGLRLTIFVDSCFWHGCPEHCRRPSSNTEYWHAKIARNAERDKRVATSLGEQGWTVLRIWEHDLTDNLPDTIERVAAVLEELRAVRGVARYKPQHS